MNIDVVKTLDAFVEGGMEYLAGRPVTMAAAAIGLLMDVYCSRENVDDDELAVEVENARENVRAIMGKAVDLIL